MEEREPGKVAPKPRFWLHLIHTQKKMFGCTAKKTSNIVGTIKSHFDFWSEQASESVHYDFGKLWADSHYKRALTNPNYAKQFLKCNITYNSHHAFC